MRYGKIEGERGDYTENNTWGGEEWNTGNGEFNKIHMGKEGSRGR